MRAISEQSTITGLVGGSPTFLRVQWGLIGERCNSFGAVAEVSTVREKALHQTGELTADDGLITETRSEILAKKKHKAEEIKDVKLQWRGP